MTGYARRIARDLSDVDVEMASELAIEKAARSIHRFDPSRGSFRSWVRGFVRIEVKTIRRTNSDIDQEFRQAARRRGTNELEVPRGRGRSEGAERIAILLTGLAPDDREILMLRGQDLPFSKIARRLRIAEPAARQRYVRASRRLRKLAAASDGPDVGDIPAHVLEA